MTIFDWTAEGGTDGSNVTVAGSSASGPAIGSTGLVINGASTPAGASGCTYSSAAAGIGALGVRIIPAAGTTYMRWDYAPGAVRVGVRRRYTHTAAPGAVATLASIKNTANGTMVDLQVDTSSRAIVTTAAGILTASRYTMTVGTTYWLEAFATVGTTTTDGRAELYVYAADGTTLLNGSGAGFDSGATTNTGTTAPGFFRFGGVTSTSGWANDDIDGIRFGDLASGVLGPPANLPPTVSVGANQSVAAAATVNVTSSASDPDGTIASRLWTFDFPTSGAPALTGASTANASFTAGAAGALYILRHTVTDNGGATAFATTEVRVPSTGNVRPIAGDGSGAAGWSIIGGAATQGAALNDASATTRVESPDMTSTASAHRWRLAPMSTRTALRITLSDVVLTAAAAHTCKVRVFCGSTQITERSLAATTSDTAPFFDLTGPEITAITDWGNVWVEAVAVI